MTIKEPAPYTARTEAERYGIAIVCALLGLLSRLTLNRVLGTDSPFITFYPGIMVSAWYGGLGPGLLTTIISALAARYVAIEPLHTFALPAGPDTLSLALFIGIGVIISWLNEALHAAQRSVVSHLRQVEREVAEKEHAQERLQLALDSANEGLWEVRPTTGDAYFGPRYHSILGYEPGELLDTTDTWESHIHPDERTSIENQLAEQIKRQGGIFVLECRMRKKDGEYIWGQIRGKVTEWTPDGSLARIVGTITDITDRKHLEAQFQQAQRLESVGRLAGGVAHDFNNLLTVINGYVAMLGADLPPDSPLQDAIKEVRDAGERAARLTHQLLAFSRKQILQPAVVNVNQIVSEIETMLRRLIGEHIALITSLAPDIGNITADVGQLHQVIVNLAVNSRDAMPTGGTLLIETSNVHLDDSYTAKHPQVRAGDYVMLAITDSGKSSAGRAPFADGSCRSTAPTRSAAPCGRACTSPFWVPRTGAK